MNDPENKKFLNSGIKIYLYPWGKISHVQKLFLRNYDV